jgi:DNA-directed RNA polymerase omega subunit
MSVHTKPPECQFAYVVLAARRARQLMAGAPPLLENPRTLKSTRIATEELDLGVLEFELPDPPGSDEKEVKRRKS